VPDPRPAINAFTASEVRDITGISIHMLNYLCVHNYLQPTYGHGTRGKVRYYSYRDLVIAQVVQRLRETGVELRRLKTAIRELRHDRAWFKSSKRRSKPIQWLVTDGKEVLLKNEDGFLDELRPGGQRAFAFIVSLGTVQAEVRAKLDAEKNKLFSIRNQRLILDTRPEAVREYRLKSSS